ncbi:hypothetical protein CLV73_2012 [Chryseobacterium geocarposphaerae]|uniref:Uncharacterized protein n=1 Tax=Chryseobacterium geocarposphaerae TaxID=1416776 RepID=A0A2M9CAZ6_9FLAO|nr:hypothetical protein CLV73_2012 [Chryseobacterium geocarposphaerae]
MNCHSDKGRISTNIYRFFTPLLNYVRKPLVMFRMTNYTIKLIHI